MAMMHGAHITRQIHPCQQRTVAEASPHSSPGHGGSSSSCRPGRWSSRSQDVVFGRVLGPLPVRQTRADGAPQLPVDVDDAQLVTPYDGRHIPMEVVLLGVAADVAQGV